MNIETVNWERTDYPRLSVAVLNDGSWVCATHRSPWMCVSGTTREEAISAGLQGLASYRSALPAIRAHHHARLRRIAEEGRDHG
jgi:hypothetical protein